MNKASSPRTKIFTHLWYAHHAEEAARLYASIFADSRVERVTALMSETPSGPPGSVKVVDFTLFGQRFQAITAGPHHEFNNDERQGSGALQAGHRRDAQDGQARHCDSREGVPFLNGTSGVEA